MTDSLAKMREICLALPDTRETITWGSPYFRVGDKIFAGHGEEDGKLSIGFKLEKSYAAALVASDSRFTPAEYVGRHGWVSMDIAGEVDWSEVEEYILESFTLIAPKRTLNKLQKTL